MSLDLEYILREKNSLLQKAKAVIGSGNVYYCESFSGTCKNMLKAVSKLIDRAYEDIANCKTYILYCIANKRGSIPILPIDIAILEMDYGINISTYADNLKLLESDLKKVIGFTDTYLREIEASHKNTVEWCNYLRIVRSCNAIGKSLHKPKVSLEQHTYTKKKIR